MRKAFLFATGTVLLGGVESSAERYADSAELLILERPGRNPLAFAMELVTNPEPVDCLVSMGRASKLKGFYYFGECRRWQDTPNRASARPGKNRVELKKFPSGARVSLVFRKIGPCRVQACDPRLPHTPHNDDGPGNYGSGRSPAVRKGTETI